MSLDPATLQQLKVYVRGSFAHRVDEATIRANLLHAGWDSSAVEEAISEERPSPHRVRNGVLWITSPFIILIAGLIFTFGMSAAHAESATVNITSILLGLVGSLMLVVGPIVGVIVLSRR